MRAGNDLVPLLAAPNLRRGAYELRHRQLGGDPLFHLYRKVDALVSTAEKDAPVDSRHRGFPMSLTLGHDVPGIPHGDFHRQAAS